VGWANLGQHRESEPNSGEFRPHQTKVFRDTIRAYFGASVYFTSAPNKIRFAASVDATAAPWVTEYGD